MSDILNDYRIWAAQQEERISTHSKLCHLWPRHEACMIHRLAAALERARMTGEEREVAVQLVLQRKFVDDEPCIYFDEESWHDSDRSEVRRNRGGLWQRGGYESYMADDEWETLEGSESQRLEAEYQRLVKAGEVEDIDTFLDRPRWIPVTEELPDNGACVLWFHSNWSSPMLLAKRDWKSLDWGGDSCLTLRGFTHWMPLPEPPEVK